MEPVVRKGLTEHSLEMVEGGVKMNRRRQTEDEVDAITAW
jgi:hypothetical protein